MTEKRPAAKGKNLMCLLLAFIISLSFIGTPLRAEAAGEITVYQGIDYAPVYDFDFYVNYNQDLTGIFGSDPIGALNHFVNYGMAEGRRANASFDVYAYMAAYGDLPAAFGSNLEAYYLHYINYGISEGRSGLGNGPAPVPAAPSSGDPEPAAKPEQSGSNGENQSAVPQETPGGPSESAETYLTVLDGVDYAPVYDFNYYISRNGDVKAVLGLDQTAVLKHFVDWGMAEGRRGNEAFDVRAYHDRYGDIQKVLGEDWKAIYMHYLDWGIQEGRSGKPDTAGNAAPANASGAASKDKSAQKESPAPKAKPVTVWDGVDYAPVYDYEYYIGHNADVKAYYGSNNPEGVLEHFVTWGMKEGRQAKESFDVKSYRNAWQDLRIAFGGDLPSYYKHYIDYGQREGRKTTGVPTLQNPVTVIRGIDFSDVYDFFYYIDTYPEKKAQFASDDIGALKDFALVGMANGLKGKASFSQARYDELSQAFPMYPKAKVVLDQIGYNLRGAYDWTKDTLVFRDYTLPRNGKPGVNYFADWGFDHLAGNCFVYSACFTQLTRMMGYDTRQVSGEVLSRHGYYVPHSWTEIDIDGTTYVFDPECEYEAGLNCYQFQYGQKGTWIYRVLYYMSDEGEQ